MSERPLLEVQSLYYVWVKKQIRPTRLDMGERAILVDYINAQNHAGCLAYQQATKKLRTFTHKLKSHAWLDSGNMPNSVAIGHVIANIWQTLVTRDPGHGETRRTKHTEISY